MTNIGITFGCFIPLHLGHMDMIQRSLTENDHTIIAVCGHDFDRGKDFIPFLRRQRLMRLIYGDRPDVTVIEIDDRAIGLTGTFSEEAWRTWSQELFRNANRSPADSCDYTWYTGDPDYIEKLEPLYPTHRFVQLDKSAINISGTAIRQNPDAYRHVIHSLFWRYLEQNGIISNERSR